MTLILPDCSSHVIVRSSSISSSSGGTAIGYGLDGSSISRSFQYASERRLTKP